MSLSQRKTFYLVSSGLLLICLAAIGGWFLGNGSRLLAAEGRNQTQAGSQEKLRALLTERYDILKDIVDSYKKSLELGHVGDGSGLKDATVAMFHAEADLCLTDAEWINVYEKLVAALREHEAWVGRKAAAGRAPEISVAQARVERLEAQISLEKLRLARQPLR